MQSAKPGAQVPSQTPALQEGVTWLAEQDEAQAPQCAGSESISTSQPSVRLSPLQSAKPGSQAPLQTPALQEGVTWLAEQDVAQPPQCVGSELVFVSQPSVRMSLLQSAKPKIGLQVALQTPPLQDGMTWLAEHGVPQPPQLLGSESTSTSQPSVRRLLLQSAKPASQVPVQLPLLHERVTWLDEQADPQPPQLLGLVEVSTQTPLHSVPPSPHAQKPALQIPLQQSTGEPHAAPTCPQHAVAQSPEKHLPLQQSSSPPQLPPWEMHALGQDPVGSRFLGVVVALPAEPSPSEFNAVTRYQNSPQDSGASSRTESVVVWFVLSSWHESVPESSRPGSVRRLPRYR